jgi:type VII secretion protein EccB
MASKRDQLHSYQFTVQKLVSALVMRDPDAEHSPFGRTSGSVFAGVMVALLLVSGFGIYGLWRPGGNQGWQHDNTVVVEKESGAVYVYRSHVLHPVLNITSALLIAGQSSSDAAQTVSRGSLAGTPRGETLGIPNAPASLPPATQMVGTPWTLCSRPDQDSAGNTITTTVLVVGQSPHGGRELADSGLLATDSDSGTTYLIWHEHRYAITDPSMVLGALLWQRKQRTTVGPAWLSALPAGTDIRGLRIDQQGSPSTAVSDARVGEVFQVRAGGASQYYVALRTALASITPMQAEIALGDPATDKAYPDGTPKAVDLAPSAANAAHQDNSLLPGGGAATPPTTAPQIIDSGSTAGAVCAAYRNADSNPRVLYDATVPKAGAASTTEKTDQGAALADRVVVPPEHAAVVDALAAPNAPGGGLNLVTDLGYRYPVPSRDVLAMLGYGSVHVTKLPGSLVARIPQGPALDPAAAKKAVAVSGP